MAIEKINFSYPKGTLQSVFDTEALTALELASKTSKKVDECIDIVNGVELTAIEATAIVENMQNIQEQFNLNNSDTRAQLITDNQIYIEGLNTAKIEFETDIETNLTNFETNINNSKTAFETNMSTSLINFQTLMDTSKTTFETSMTNEVAEIIANSEQIIKNDVDLKVADLINNGVLADINEELQDIGYNIKTKFNAIGDGVTDDTNAFINAINAGCKKIIVPQGVYKVRPNEIILGEGQSIIGSGKRNNCIISIDGNVCNAFTLNGKGNIIKDITIKGNGVSTSGDAILIKESGINIENVYIVGTYNAITVKGFSARISTIFMNNLLIENVVNGGIYVENVNDIFISNFLINAWNTTSSYGIKLYNNVEAFNLINGDILKSKQSLYIASDTNIVGNKPAYCKFEQVYFDSSVWGVLVRNSAVMKFVNCWFSNRPGKGCTVETSIDVEFSNCEFMNNGGDGIFIDNGCKFIKILGGSVHNNNQSANGGNGINIAGGVTDFIITNVMISNALGGTGQQVRGILINTGACDRYIITNNICNGNSVAQITDNGTGTNKYIANNF